MQPKIVIIDDEIGLCKLLTIKLEARGFDVRYAHNGLAGLRLVFDTQPDLVIIDVIMPKMDGFETSERLRELSDVPILMLTARTDEEDIVRGFHCGVDDYVRKPFGMEELIARVTNLLQRANRKVDKETGSYSDDILQVNLENTSVHKRGEMLQLSPTEFKLLASLVRHRNTIVPHELLLKEVWGDAYLDAKASLNLYIRYLRTKIEDDPRNPIYIRTQWGIGYWFAAQGTEPKV